MRTTYDDLYGWKDVAREAVAKDLATILGIAPKPHDSSYFGDYDQFDAKDHGKAKLMSNFADEDGELLEPKFPQYKILLNISGPIAKDHEQQIKDLKGATLLRRGKQAIKTIIIDGNNFSDVQSFYDEAQQKLCPGFREFGRNLDAFNDILFGGFGVFGTGENIKLVWKNSAKSKRDLGKTFDTLLEIIRDNPNIHLSLG